MHEIVVHSSETGKNEVHRLPIIVKKADVVHAIGHVLVSLGKSKWKEIPYLLDHAKFLFLEWRSQEAAMIQIRRSSGKDRDKS